MIGGGSVPTSSRISRAASSSPSCVGQAGLERPENREVARTLGNLWQASERLKRVRCGRVVTGRLLDQRQAEQRVPDRQSVRVAAEPVGGQQSIVCFGQPVELVVRQPPQIVPPGDGQIGGIGIRLHELTCPPDDVPGPGGHDADPGQRPPRRQTIQIGWIGGLAAHPFEKRDRRVRLAVKVETDAEIGSPRRRSRGRRIWVRRRTPDVPGS